MRSKEVEEELGVSKGYNISTLDNGVVVRRNTSTCGVIGGSPYTSGIADVEHHIHILNTVEALVICLWISKNERTDEQRLGHSELNIDELGNTICERSRGNQWRRKSG